MYMGFCAHRYAQLYGNKTNWTANTSEKYSQEIFALPVTKFIHTMAAKLIAFLLYVVALNKIKFVTIFKVNIFKVTSNQHHAVVINYTARIQMTNLEMTKLSLFIINVT